MPRVKRGVTSHARHKKIVKAAKGYRLGRKNRFKMAKQAVIRASQNAYIGRRLRKRDFRRLWITRLSAAAQIEGMNYSTLMSGLRKAKVILNRKMLSEIAISSPETFTQIAKLAK